VVAVAPAEGQRMAGRLVEAMETSLRPPLPKVMTAMLVTPSLLMAAVEVVEQVAQLPVKLAEQGPQAQSLDRRLLVLEVVEAVLEKVAAMPAELEAVELLGFLVRPTQAVAAEAVDPQSVQGAQG